jgi:hypothetical protein
VLQKDKQLNYYPSGAPEIIPVLVEEKLPTLLEHLRSFLF